MSGDVVITGASGQVGGAVLRALPSGVVTTIARRRPVGLSAPHQHIEADLGSDALALPGLSGGTAILLASRISMSNDVAEMSAQLALELRGNLAVLERMPDLARVVYVSSCTVYGAPNTLPVSEGAPLLPANVYACGKVIAEDVLRILAERRGIPLAILRVAQVYGPGSPDTEIVARFARTVRSGQPPHVSCGETSYRDYVHEDDVADAIWNSAKLGVAGIFNIGAGASLSIAAMAREACRIASIAPPEVTSTGSTYSMLLDITRARERLNYHPVRTVEQELRRRVRA